MIRQGTRHHMYIAQQDDDKISIFTLNPATGALSFEEDVPIEGGPAPLAIAPDKRVLYVGRRGSQEIGSIRVSQ